MKKIALINSEIEDTVINYFKDKNVEILNEIRPCNLIILNNANNEELKQISDSNQGKVINIHPSLLPAFEDVNAVEKAFLSGVKVSGVTIHSTDKIIAQYPVLIGIDTHIDEFKKDIIEVEKRLVPPVIDAILNDRVFDFQDLFKNPCSHKNGGCSSCMGCH